ncbi:unnamed protein product, partial [Discosporangium mesarthrocarpum]
QIRLREPLPVLCRSPEIYNRSKVSMDCFEALQRLRCLRKAMRLAEVALQMFFPEAGQLIQVESKYGESVTLKDIQGFTPPRRPGRGKSTKATGGTAGTTGLTKGGVECRGERGGEVKTGGSEVRKMQAEGGASHKEITRPARRKADTDATNPAYERWLAERPTRDFLVEQGEASLEAWKTYQQRKVEREEELREETVPTSWCYGPQKLNYVEMKKAEMRERLAKDKAATYTYSTDYVSQTLSLVDEHRIKEDEKARNRAAWKTIRGFVWPFPKTPHEYIVHPHKPSESRIDVLKEPWIENELRGGRIEEEQSGGSTIGRGEFNTVPSNGQMLFGGLQPPGFSRSLDTSLIGSRSRLPRGRQTIRADPDFFRSVHLVGDGLELEKAESRRKEEELWRSKVVVDDTDFHVGSFSVRDRPLQTERAKDILHSPVRKTAFRMVRNARLPSGRRAPLHPPPVSVFASDPFTDPRDFTEDLRRDRPELFTAADPSTGGKLDFQTHLHKDRMKPRSHVAVARRKHPPLRKDEMRGPSWERNPQPMIS